jgi:hypothetical protein
MKRGELVAAAKELNALLDLKDENGKPMPIDVKASFQEVAESVLEASTLLTKRDKITKETAAAVEELRRAAKTDAAPIVEDEEVPEETVAEAEPQEAVAEAEPASAPARRGRPRKVEAVEVKPNGSKSRQQVKPPGSITKKEKLRQLLSAENGVTHEEMKNSLGWPSGCLGTASVLAKKEGKTLEKIVHEGEPARYRIAA